ncbi:hypothetical protein Q9S36_13125 [Microbacterium sp. ARD31]|nr:hypothetical protein [Microbacterium sp. ARD31]
MALRGPRLQRVRAPPEPARRSHGIRRRRNSSTALAISTAPPDAVSRAANRDRWNSISASNASASGSRGSSPDTTRASRIASSARSGRTHRSPAVAAYPSVNTR